jgi:alkanesulfonate monooxygenase
MELKPVRPGGPPFFLAGASEAAIDMAARQADVYMMSAHTPENIGQRIADVRARVARAGRTDEPRFCVAGILFARATDRQAREFAREFVEHADLAVVAERAAPLTPSARRPSPSAWRRSLNARLWSRRAAAVARTAESAGKIRRRRVFFLQWPRTDPTVN